MERGTFREISELTTCVTRDRLANNRDFFVGERENTTTGTERELSSTIHSETAERSCFVITLIICITLYFVSRLYRSTTSEVQTVDGGAGECPEGRILSTSRLHTNREIQLQFREGDL